MLLVFTDVRAGAGAAATGIAEASATWCIEESEGACVEEAAELMEEAEEAVEESESERDMLGACGCDTAIPTAADDADIEAEVEVVVCWIAIDWASDA